MSKIEEEKMTDFKNEVLGMFNVSPDDPEAEAKKRVFQNNLEVMMDDNPLFSGNPNDAYESVRVLYNLQFNMLKRLCEIGENQSAIADGTRFYLEGGNLKVGQGD